LADIAASFQKAVVEVLVLKTLRAAKEFKAKSIMLSGGVATNKLLRRTFKKESAKLGYNFFAPQAEYNTDNAVMIAIAGYMRNLQKSAGGGAPSEGDGSRPRAYGEKKYKLEARGDLDI
jgi:N6-L-threonylcarbamoyladenine synthase